MNRERRKELSRAIHLIEQAAEIVEVVRDAEQEAFDNLPESFQNAERGQDIELWIDELDQFLDEITMVGDMLERDSFLL